MQIEELEIDAIKPYKNNPRDNDQAVQAVANSIKDFGFKVPIVIDRNNEIICGHTRHKASRLLGLKKVPCIRAEDLTEEQVRAFRLADNKTAELATWNEDLLNLELNELSLDMEDYGFEIEAYAEATEFEEDDYPVDEDLANIKEPKTQEGDLIRLGQHFLLCGDSTQPEAVKRVLQGEQADLILTDPPYNVNYTGQNGMQIKNDNLDAVDFDDLLFNSFSRMEENLKDGGSFYIFYADLYGLQFRKALQDAGLQMKENLIWNKNTFTLGWSDYQWKHEPILYGYKGKNHYFTDSRSNATIIDETTPEEMKKKSKEELLQIIEKLQQRPSTIIDEKKPTNNDLHPTTKPVNLVGYLLQNSTHKNDLVLDSFGGSGTTLVACEQAGRRCRMIELDRRYCDVIINRWEKLTGGKAEVIR